MGPRGRALRPTALSVSWVAACVCPARVQPTDGTRQVVAHAATGPERAHLGDRSRSLHQSRWIRPSPISGDSRGGPRPGTEAV